MLKQVGSAALAFVVITASSLAFAQQPRPGKPAAKPPTTRAIVVQESDEKATPTSPAVAPAPEDKVLAKPVGPGVPVAKPAAPPPVAEKPPPSAEKSPPVVEKAPPTEKPPVVVKKPPFKEKPVVRAKPPQYRPRYGYGGGGYY